MGERHQEKQKAGKPRGGPELRACGHGMYLLAGIEKGHRRGVDGPDVEVIYRRLEGAAAADFAGGIDEPSCNHQANPETGLS